MGRKAHHHNTRWLRRRKFTVCWVTHFLLRVRALNLFAARGLLADPRLLPAQARFRTMRWQAFHGPVVPAPGTGVAVQSGHDPRLVAGWRKARDEQHG